MPCPRPVARGRWPRSTASPWGRRGPGGRAPAALDEPALDLLTYRAERLRMHRLVLSTLDRERSAALTARRQGGEELRVFSVGIGGLALGMGQGLGRAEGDRGRPR